MQSFTLIAVTPGRKEIAIRQDADGKSARIVKIDPKAKYNAEDLRALAAMFEGVAKLLA